MRNIWGISFLSILVIILFAFNGCGDGDSEIQSNVITENDLFANPQLIATPEQTLVIQLEAPDGEGQVNDIGEKGMDEVPLYYSEDVNQTFCWEEDTTDAGHSMELIDSSGNIVLTEYINGECTGATIPAGHYTMRLIHGGQSEDTQSIFIRSVEDISSIRGIVNTASVQDNIETLISTNSCIGCDLHDANLAGVYLIGAKLSSADLSRANLSSAKLSEADLKRANLILADLSWANLNLANLTKAGLTHANLSHAYLNGTCLDGAIMYLVNLSRANLNFAILSGAILQGASLSGATLINTALPYADLSHAYLVGADLTRAILNHANLTKANLTGAILTNADLTWANLSGATWIDGTTICEQGSFGECLRN